MKRYIIAGITLVGLVLLGALAGGDRPSNVNDTAPYATSSNNTPVEKIEKTTPTCDGTVITTDCRIDGVDYITYIHHPAIEEVSHTETTTTYRQEVASYCTLCNDGTYSPSCATGRGACSHHGGVAQWNAPRYRSVPEYSTKIIVDTPAQEAYYEKVPK